MADQDQHTAVRSGRRAKTPETEAITDITKQPPTSVAAYPSEIYSLEHVDIALSRKIHLVNDAIDEIGWTPYHWKLFVLNGFGYAVDSLITLLQSIVRPQVILEMNPTFPNGTLVALYVGLLLGALFWGLGADVIGRRTAFNTSLFVCSIFAIVAGASPNYPVLGLFVALSAFGAGGNLILDTTVFLEYLPSSKQWALTLLAGWWGVGQMVAGLIAWPFMADYSCSSAENCTRANNMGWRYIWFVNGGLVFVLSVLRVTIVRLMETPKFLLGEGKDAQVVETLQWIAKKYNRSCSLTTEQLEAYGTISSSKAKNRFSTSELMLHLKGLFLTRRLALSTLLIWWSWMLIGLAYPLFNAFLPTYLESRGASTGETSTYITWRNYAIANLAGVWGPFLAAALCEVPFLGRRGAMVIGALLTMIFFFAYTAVRTPAQNLGFTCAIGFCVNVYYGCLYAYTPEVLPSAHRGTGNGVSVALNRVMGIISAVIATFASPTTVVPIYLCAALYIVMAFTAMVLPFEPLGRRSV